MSDKKYISKKKLFEMMCFYNVYPQDMSQLEFINKLSNADVEEVRHAKWVDGACSNCGTEKPIVIAYRGFNDIVYQYQGELNYCPNCGAKMDKEQKE